MFIKFHFIIFHLIEGKEKVQLKKINFDIVRVSLGETFWIVPTGGSHGVELWAAGTTDGGQVTADWRSSYPSDRPAYCTFTKYRRSIHGPGL